MSINLPHYQKVQLDKEYGEGNWNLTGGKGYAASGSVRKTGKSDGSGMKVPVYSKVPTTQVQEPAPDPTPVPAPQRTTGPVDSPQRLPVGNRQQQSNFDPMAMMMLPMLLKALEPKPVPKAPEPTTYASVGQAAKSASGVKVKRSKVNKSRQNTKGTRGTFNRNDLRISNLNI